jgi:hypothetical protein
MRLIDQHGAVSFAWFPPGTPTDPGHILQARLYAALCRLTGIDPSSPWVAFPDRRAALAAVFLATSAAG